MAKQIKPKSELKNTGKAKSAMAKTKAKPAAKQAPKLSKSGPAKMPTLPIHKQIENALPPGSTILIDLPKLSNIEIDEISEQLVLVMRSEKGYNSTSTAVSDSLLDSPSGLIGERMIARSGKGGTYILRFGYRQFMTQSPKFWVLGVIIGNNNNLAVNPDLKLIEPQTKKMLTSLKEMRGGLTVKDLTAKIIQLSYVDADNALSMLKGFGITTGSIPPKINFANLPYVTKIDDPKSTYTGLVGSKGTTRGGSFGLSMSPGDATSMSDNAIGTPLTQLLVMFHPAHPEQFSRVRRVLDEYIDRPARQIFIEGMVLEISQNGLNELGVDWAWNSYTKEDGTPILSNLRGGSTKPGSDSVTSTFEAKIPNLSTFHNVFTGEFQWDWEVSLRALVRQGKAQILSRPSVLTLNNRQSTIRVGKDIPIASSLQGNNINSISAFKFQYLSTGILLNIRPRINEAGDEVTMLIDTVVSAPVPNEDMRMESSDGTELAKAPTVSTRRVQTYGRIDNNTPLIIGGLVANEKISVNDKIPFLGDIPLVGRAFSSKKTETEKREVIIVLTPHVLPDKKQERRSLPKDEDLFDSFGHDLFRDSYRIRSEDVFDLTFLLENERIKAYRKLAREAAQKNYRLGEIEPYRCFVKDSIPGEPMLVTRMIYEVIKRLNIEKEIDQSRMIYFGGQKVGGYDVEFLDKLIKGKGSNIKDFGDKALALIFRYEYKSPGSQPIPQVKEIECRNRDEWETKLWELNQPDENGNERNTILIKGKDDIVRLRRALALKKIANLNGGSENMRLKNFSAGKTLLMPEFKENQIHVIGSEVAKYFFHTEHYYASTLKQIKKNLKQLDTELRQPEIETLLSSPLPDRISISDEIKEMKHRSGKNRIKENNEQDYEARIKAWMEKRDREKAAQQNKKNKKL